jgi:hypothetical protein
VDFTPALMCEIIPMQTIGSACDDAQPGAVGRLDDLGHVLVGAGRFLGDAAK